MNNNLLINNLFKVEKIHSKLFRNFILVISGVAFLSVMAQFSVNLPFTPIPITGQTLAVFVIALVYGSKLGSTTLISYITLGSMGAPVFSGGKFGFPFLLPTGGYIIGFLFITIVCGYLSEIGFTKSYSKLLLTIIIGELLLYTCGLLQLSIFIPDKNIFELGLYPFILGDIIKITLLISILPNIWKFIKNEEMK